MSKLILYRVKDVYTHHPAVLTWVFSSHRIPTTIQQQVVKTSHETPPFIIICSYSCFVASYNLNQSLWQSFKLPESNTLPDVIIFLCQEWFTQSQIKYIVISLNATLLWRLSKIFLEFFYCDTDSFFYQLSIWLQTETAIPEKLASIPELWYLLLEIITQSSDHRTISVSSNLMKYCIDKYSAQDDNIKHIIWETLPVTMASLAVGNQYTCGMFEYANHFKDT